MAHRRTRLALALIALALALCAPGSASADTHTLTVVRQSLQTPGTVTSSPAGIVCGSTCTNSFSDPQIVLTASPVTGFSISWQGVTCVGAGEDQTGSSCTIDNTADQTATVRYIDATAPTISLTSPSSSGPFHGNLGLAASAFDSQSDISRVDFTVGATVVGTDTTSPYQFTLDTTALRDGQVSIGAVAYNGDNQARTANPRSVTIDNNPPVLSITSGPDGQTFGPGTTQTFTFTATDASDLTTVCSIDSENQFSQCTDSASYTDLPEGAHTFHVRAVDAAGNQTDATRTFAIDRTGPATTITSGPDDFSSTAIGAASFTFSAGEDGATFVCRLYPAAATVPDFGSCSGPGNHSASGLAPGEWTFEVQSFDAYGNAGTVASRHFFVVFGGVLDRVDSVVSARFAVRGKSTSVQKLRVAKMPTGTRVTLSCRGRTCPFKSRTVTARGGRATLEQLFEKRPLRSGTLIELRITAAGLTGQLVRFTTRSGHQPTRSALCLPSGASTPVACG